MNRITTLRQGKECSSQGQISAVTIFSSLNNNNKWASERNDEAGVEVNQQSIERKTETQDRSG